MSDGYELFEEYWLSVIINIIIVVIITFAIIATLIIFRTTNFENLLSKKIHYYLLIEEPSIMKKQGTKIVNGFYLKEGAMESHLDWNLFKNKK